ncbi:MAG: methionine aminotransferase [Bacteroidetes bacterium]|nr:methionine aminotransferase [Bacteroidota bacterium]
MEESNTKIFSKLPNVGTTIFTTMFKMAADYGAINLSQGFPDFDCPEDLKKLVVHYLQAGHNQYAPMPGLPLLRERISSKIEKLYGHKYNPETEINITAGATQALFTAISAVINPGDEAIIFEPAYDSYAPGVIANCGVPVFIPLREKDFSIDWDRCKDSITNKTKLIIINSPHNPTGSVINIADLKNLEEITRDTNILILSDEVYEHIVFDGNRHISVSRSGELARRTFVVSSFGKTYHTTGWKIGYCAAPEYLMKEFRKLHQFIVFAVNTPIQNAYADYMANENHYLSLGLFYQKKRDLIINALKESRFKLNKTRGTYFQLLDYSAISDKNDYEFSEYLTREIGVAVIPLSPFYSKNNSRKLVRICFAKRDEVLLEAAEKLCRV